MNTKWKKNDLILILIVLLAAVLLLVFHKITDREKAHSVVTVRVDGQVTGVYDLKKDCRIDINGGTNQLVIKDGVVDMVEANCPDKLCVKQRPVSRNHESIICLPNKIIVEITEQEESGPDAIAR